MPRTNPAPPVSHELMKRYEVIAQSLRERAGAGPLGPLDPFELARRLGVVIEYSRSLEVKDWSGMSKPLPDGRLFVMLHAGQTPERMNATLLEEIVHHVQGHTPVQIGPGGRSEYNEAEEQEARFSAAAALLPMKAVAQAVLRRDDPTRFAALHGASVELFEMRVKTLGLWALYKDRSPLPEGVR